ncbi:alpha/beta fold hydrolase [Ureibacillus sp. NPDC094379]
MLHYSRKGNGETLVLVHGFLGAKEIFNEVIEEFTTQFDVIAVDLPGHGQSQLEKESYSVYDYAEAVTEVLKHEGVKEAIWLGHSMGGYITLAALEKNMFPIKKAILAYTSDLADSDEQKEKRTKQQQQIPEIGVNGFVDEIIEAFFGQNATKEMVDIARRIGYRATEKGLIAALDAMKSRPNQHQLVEQTNKAILVLEGTEDKIVKPIIVQNSTVNKIVTSTGHFGMLEDPESFIKAVQEFID